MNGAKQQKRQALQDSVRDTVQSAVKRLSSPVSTEGNSTTSHVQFLLALISALMVAIVTMTYYFLETRIGDIGKHIDGQTEQMGEKISEVKSLYKALDENLTKTNKELYEYKLNTDTRLVQVETTVKLRYHSENEADK